MQVPMPDDATIQAALRQPALRSMDDADALINVYRLMCWSPEAAAAIAQVGAALFTTISLTPANRELVILACAATFRSSYEADQHLVMSRRAGITDDQRSAIAGGNWQDPCFTHHQHQLLAFVRAVVQRGTVGARTSGSLQTSFSERELVETVILVGTYFLIARLTTVFEIPSDPPADHRLLALAQNQADDPASSPDPHQANGASAPSAHQVVDRLVRTSAEGPTPKSAELDAQDAIVELPVAGPGACG